ncbi:MAG: DUF91 domain-containing protein [Geobacteraceae bacterium]|nr:DUF91 domain-containing protein [Geobacteraceae bacterium]
MIGKLSELDMENAIAAEPEKILRESGLKLVARQYRIGSYIFDLLFEDRHGAKMIVEIQLGTLDRNHTYKILDYYDEYKEKHLGEFIELMVVANTITHERRKRLNALGVSHREIPAEAFLSLDSTTGQPLIDMKAVQQTAKKCAKVHGQLISLASAYNLFKEQGKEFIKALEQVQPPVRVLADLTNLSNDYRGPRLISIAPESWGRKENNGGLGQGSGYGPGVGVFLNCYYAKNLKGTSFVRLQSGIENPFKEEFRDSFKKEYDLKQRV